ncbi:MAG: SCO family protein [Spirochaetia bacterium]|nr:SCO family protein [Spirochaetia bacterium]
MQDKRFQSNNDKKEKTDFEKLQDWFGGWQFPVLALFVLGFLALILFLILFIPNSQSGVGKFAEEFKIWCYGLNPETGEMKTAYIVMFLSDPFVLGSIIYFIWKGQIDEVFKKTPKKVIPYVGIAFGVVILLTLGLSSVVSETSFERLKAKTEIPQFPGNDIRTQIPAKNFKLTDHKGTEIELENYKGNVVIITSFFTNCLKACPTILFQLKKAVESVPEDRRNKLKAFAITMDPENDTKENLIKTAKHHKLTSNEYHLLNGDPKYVNEVLDSYNYGRKKDEKTGEYDHENIFLVIDKKGLLAYKFAMGNIGELWLKEAISQLLNES